MQANYTEMLDANFHKEQLGHKLEIMERIIKKEITRSLFSSRRRHTRWPRDWSSDVCSSDLQRLNLSQAFNPMGSLLGMLAAQLIVIEALRSDQFTTDEYNALGILEKTAIREHDLGVISLPYIGLGILVLIILFIIILTRFPIAREDQTMTFRESYALLLKNPRYYEGVIAQGFYVGAQIMCWTFIFQYVDHMNTLRPPDEQLTATWYNMAAMISFLAGRWLCTWLLRFISSPRLMLLFSVGGVLACTGTILLPGMAGLYSLVSISIFMSLMFPTIYGIALEGMGDEAKLGCAGLVMAIVGGALMPP